MNSGEKISNVIDLAALCGISYCQINENVNNFTFVATPLYTTYIMNGGVTLGVILLRSVRNVCFTVAVKFVSSVH